MIRLDVRKKEDLDMMRALLRLPFHEDFKTYSDFLEKKLADLRKQNDVSTGIQQGWLQGWCQAFQYMIELPKHARTEAKKQQ